MVLAIVFNILHNGTGHCLQYLLLLLRIPITKTIQYPILVFARSFSLFLNASLLIFLDSCVYSL